MGPLYKKYSTLGPLAVLMVGLPLSALQASSVSETLEFTGSFEMQTAVAFQGTSLQKSEFILTPEVSFSLSDKTHVTLIGRLRADVKDRLEPGAPSDPNRTGFSGRLTLGDWADAELREAYIDTEIAGAYLRLGKQQIVWGQADGLKVLDVLNPQSFREFILPEFDESRTALWSVNAEIPLGDYSLQLVWIPDTTYNDIPAPGSAYAFTSPLFVPTAPAGVPVTFAPIDKPNDAFADSDIGVKLSAFLGGWDLSLNYAYHYQDNPVTRRTVTETGISVAQNYQRSHLMGGTFSNVFGDFTLRGELGYSTDKWFQTADIADADGVVRSDEFAYVFGLDYGGFSDWFISAQIFQSFLTNSTAGLYRDGTDTNITVLIQRDFMNEALRLENLWIHNVNQGDGALQFSVNYEWRSNIRLKAGADIFYGTNLGLYGQFNESDRLSFGVEVSF